MIWECSRDLIIKTLTRTKVTGMATRAPQASVTSLARYAVAKQPGVDLFNGRSSRDYCNSFWGTGDAGPNLMFARMRGASKTTDELRNFWNERCLIAELLNP